MPVRDFMCLWDTVLKMISWEIQGSVLIAISLTWKKKIEEILKILKDSMPCIQTTPVDKNALENYGSRMFLSSSLPQQQPQEPS